MLIIILILYTRSVLLKFFKFCFYIIVNINFVLFQKLQRTQVFRGSKIIRKNYFKSEVKGIKNVLMMIGQFLEAVKPNTGIIESTTGSNYYAPPPGPAPAEPKPTAPKTMADPVPALSVLFGERVFASLLEKRLAAAQGLSFQAVILKVSTWFGSIIVKDLSSASAETGQPTSKNSEQVTCIVGSPCVGKHLLLELLSPISFHHGVNFLAAVAVAWHKRLQPSINPKRILEASTNQQVLVQMVSRIKVMFIGALVQTVHQVIKTPLPINGVKEYFSLEVWIFEIFYIYMQNYTTQTLVESWTSHLVYLKTVLP